jgi:integrase/recombinase XerD
LPSAVLSVEEVEQIMAVPDIDTPIGLRDRTMLEVLYTTGIRRSELCRLRLGDLDAGRGVLAVRQGKGDKDRFVPVGARALAWLAKYRAEARPKLAVLLDEGALFLSVDGTSLNPNYVGTHVRLLLDKAGIDKPGACHLFRHTAATLMLEGGADIRYIQQFLGHASMATTQIYTRVSLHQLKAVHAACHPGAKLERRPESD